MFIFFQADISSRATHSVRSSVMNLSTKDQSIKFETVTEAVAEEFCHAYAPGKDVKVIIYFPLEKFLISVKF